MTILPVCVDETVLEIYQRNVNVNEPLDGIVVELVTEEMDDVVVIPPVKDKAVTVSAAFPEFTKLIETST